MNTLEAFVRWLGMSDHTGGRRGRDRGDLVADKSGAIMVAGVFMAPLLAAGVFYIIGTGDAIIYRERLQDAADAAAYTSAGVHARGMNLIVLINLIMAALLAVLILFRAIVMILGIAIVACGICIAAAAASFGIGCIFAPVCALSTPTMTQIVARLKVGSDRYAQLLNVALPALSGLQKGIALATPWVGGFKGSNVAAYYKPIETNGYVVSPSMIPGMPKNKIGLPVEEMAYDKFCQKASTLAIDKGFGWLGGGITKILNWVAGGLIKVFSGYFCGNDKGSAKELLKKKFDDMIKDGCDKQKDSCNDASAKAKASGNYEQKQCTGDSVQDAGGCISKYCNIGLDFDTARCVNDGKKTAADKQNELGGFDGSGGGINQGQTGFFKLNKTPKDIWTGAEHGGIWFQVFAVTKGDQQWPRRNDRGLAIATKTGAMPNVQASFGNWRIAQAEFYFDSPGKWKDLKENCMWRMGWRARLRRFNLTGLNLAKTGADQILGQAFDTLSKKLGDWLGSKTGSVLGTGVGTTAFDKLTDKFKEAIGDSNSISVIDGAIDQYLPSWEFVH